MAAGEFVALIEQLEGAVKAIEECERQAARWHARRPSFSGCWTCTAWPATLIGPPN